MAKAKAAKKQKQGSAPRAARKQIRAPCAAKQQIRGPCAANKQIRAYCAAKSQCKEELGVLIHFLEGCASLQVCRVASSPALSLHTCSSQCCNKGEQLSSVRAELVLLVLQLGSA